MGMKDVQENTESGFNAHFDSYKEDMIMNRLFLKFGPEVFSPGLERTRVVYHLFIDHFKKRGTKVITIAGTNGKGQTAHTLGSFFREEKRSFALWTSPHILSIRERFYFSQADENISRDVSYDELESAIDEAESLLDLELSGVRVSFYEFLFLVFLLLSKKIEKLDYLILEVGLGGRLDAVNHFDADCACITSISRDHQAILGTRYDQILSEKIAVARKNRPLFTNFKLNYLNELTCDYTKKYEVQWMPLVNSQEKASYFYENQSLAWEIFRYFESNSSQVFLQAMKKLPAYKGRREIMTFLGKSLIFIGAHNIDGIRRMIQNLEEVGFKNSSATSQSVLVSFSQRPEGEAEVMLKTLTDYFSASTNIVLTSFDHPKAMSEAVLKKACHKVNKGMLNFVSDWKSELQNSNSETVLVCGSYYFVGEVQRFILS